MFFQRLAQYSGWHVSCSRLDSVIFWLSQAGHGIQRVFPKGWGWLAAVVLGEAVVPEALELSWRVAVRLLRIILAL